MRKVIAALLAGLLLCAQTPMLPGFPPGTFQNRAALDATAGGGSSIAFSFQNTGNPGNVGLLGFSFSAGGNTINNNDIIVIWAEAQAGGSDPGSLLPTGFIAFTGGDFFDGANTAERFLFAYKVAGVAETGVYPTPIPAFAITFSSYGMVVYSGSTGIDTSSASINSSSTSAVAPSLTAAGANEFYVGLSSDEGNAAPYTNFSGLTSRVLNTGGGKSPMQLRAADKQLSASGATGTFTGTNNSATVYGSGAVLLKP